MGNHPITTPPINRKERVDSPLGFIWNQENSRERKKREGMKASRLIRV
jgi:hypothetical protein